MYNPLTGWLLAAEYSGIWDWSIHQSIDNLLGEWGPFYH